jgi:hypothetical protein
MLLIVAGGQFARFVVNVICEDSVWFILIFHLSNHSRRRSRCCCSFCDANAGPMSIARRTVSSAKVAIVVLLPCGTPDFASLCFEWALFYFTWKYLSEMYDFNSR